MSLKTQSVEVRTVVDLAALAVFTASKDGGMIAADLEARRILDANPDDRLRPETPEHGGQVSNFLAIATRTHHL